jgi:hypothetical protein
MKLTLSKWGLGSPLGLLKLQSSIVGVKTPCTGVLFISLKNYQSADVENGSHGPFEHLKYTLWQKKGQDSNWQLDSRPLKVGNRLNLDACRSSVTHCWKALEESYKFALDFIPIKGLSKEL